jgi:uncharacterized protein (DUF697 family)
LSFIYSHFFEFRHHKDSVSGDSDQSMTTEQEQQARLQVLVAIARADGEIQPWERTLLEQALKAIAPRSSWSLDHILDEQPSLESVLGKITTPHLQQATYEEAIAFAQLDGITPAEHRLLERVRSAFKIQSSSTAIDAPSNLSFNHDPSHHDPSPPPLSPEASPRTETAIDWASTALTGRSLILGMRRIVEHSAKARALVLDYAIGAAIIGLIPIPGLTLWQILAIALLLVKMMRDIGAYWGFPKGRDVFATIGNLFGGMGALAMTFMAWLTLFLIGLVLPPIRSLALAAAFFTLTWTLGQITNQFYMSSSRMDVAALRRASQRMQRKKGRSPWSQFLARAKALLNLKSKL